ncbi:MAG: hypothetical protein HC933_01775 [Pleurocapsa sp. SU_196_0]|nr:hypothetical protein [Pleurocapsa sp. SU_196_0]
MNVAVNVSVCGSWLVTGVCAVAVPVSGTTAVGTPFRENVGLLLYSPR